MSIYLIDYENVNLGGLSGIETLNEMDRVYLFYGANPGYIPFEKHILISKCRAEVTYLRVDRSGKNYLDFQLATYSGYLVAMYSAQEYVIVSRDTGFDSIVNFWNRDPEMRDVHFVRRDTILPMPQINRNPISIPAEIQTTIEPLAAMSNEKTSRRRKRSRGQRRKSAVEQEAPEQIVDSLEKTVEEQPIVKQPDEPIAPAIAEEDTREEKTGAWGKLPIPVGFASNIGVSIPGAAASGKAQSASDDTVQETVSEIADRLVADIPAPDDEKPIEKKKGRRGTRKKPDTKKVEPIPAEVIEANEEKATPAKLPERFKARIREAVKEEGLNSGGYTQIYNRVLKSENKSRLNNELVKAFSQEKGSRVYKAILSVYEEYQKSLHS